MKRQTRHHNVQLAVIGTGLAGLAASIFALERGITTAQIGNTGAVAYTTGYFDLLGATGGHVINDPWQGIDALRRVEPDHPLSRISNDDIRTAFVLFTKAVSAMGVGYTQLGERNQMALLPAGLAKPTLSVPNTMMSGIIARERRARALIVDFAGLQNFSAKEFCANMGPSWPGLSAVSVAFPDMECGGQLYAEVMARALEVPKNRARLAERICEHIGDAQYVGLPAILGIHKPDIVHHEMEQLLGVPLFEIPTLPPAVPGIRLREMFEQVLPKNGLSLVPQQKVQRVEFDAKGVTLYLQDNFGDVVIEAEAAILATGRFLSGGLVADRNDVREGLLDIAVRQPDNRADWHRQDYFDARGHPINRLGIDVDEQGRPLNAQGNLVDERLFAAGTVLAHQDWVRQRCGAGVAIASSYKAVESASKILINTHDLRT